MNIIGRKRIARVNNKNIINIFLLFLLTVLIIYKTPQILATIFQIVLFIAFWHSKKDYFWLAFLFIIESEVGFLFTKIDAVHSFSLLPNSPFGNLYFSFVFILVALVKYYRIKLQYSFFLKVNIMLIMCYFLIQLLVFGAYKISAVVRLTTPWLFLFIIPRMLKDEQEIFRFFNLIFPFVFLVLLTQIFKILTGLEFATLLGGVASETVKARGGIIEVGFALRPVYGIFIPFIAVWGSIYFLTLKKDYYSKNYILVILGLSSFSIFLTATRSWLIVALFLFGFYIILASRNPVKNLIQVFFALTLIIVLVQFIPFMQKQTDLAIKRYETLEYLIYGDLTAGGTTSRFDVRAKRPMEGFSRNPIIGWGVSDEYARYSDGHVGYHNLLMSSGIIGFAFWMLLWLNFIIKMVRSYNRIKRSNPYKNIPLVLIAFALSILILHTSVQWFGYMIDINNALVMLLLFTLGHQMYNFRSVPSRKLKENRLKKIRLKKVYSL